jgi:hypothetical protein
MKEKLRLAGRGAFVLPVNEPKKDGSAQRTRGQNPIVKRKVRRSSDGSAPPCCTCTAGAILNLGSVVPHTEPTAMKTRRQASANVQE